MGRLTDTLIDQIRKQLVSHDTVVWYDPDQSYSQVARSLAPEEVAGAAVYRYEPERGFLWLRRELEGKWVGSRPPRLLIYVPLAQAAAEYALIEFEMGGAVLRPGQQPSDLNTALAVVARRALAGVFPPAAVDEIVTQVERGTLSLAELDTLAEKGVEAQTGALAVVFGSGNAAEIALCFLSSPSLDQEIEAKQVLGGLSGILSGAYGAAFAGGDPVALRAQVARLVLVTDLVSSLGAEVPDALRTVPIPDRSAARQAAVELARTWRNRRDLADSYVQWARIVQGEFGLSELGLGLAALAASETFPDGEALLQVQVEEQLRERPSQQLVDLARSRAGGFWPTHEPAIKIGWEVIADAGELLVRAADIENALKGKTWSAGALLQRYTQGETPWCAMDTAQRHLERDYHRFELDPSEHDALIRLVSHARQRYATVSNDLAEQFLRAYADAQFLIGDALLQTDVYQHAVAPAAAEGPVAYILVDALRFEMARELTGMLGPGWTFELTPALATAPTMTEVGMVALMPGAEAGIAITPHPDKGLCPAISGQVLQTRQERLDYARQVIGGRTAVAKLDQLAPLSGAKLAQSLRSANVILVTATEEIDGLCESNPALARRMLDDVLNQLRRAIKALFGLRVRSVVISADHGYLFGEALTSGQGIDAPRGQTAALKRRVWVGQGGADLPGVLRRPLSAFGVGGPLELATPWNLSCFKVQGGGTEYFHGGLSLPELVIPVLTVRPGVAPAATVGAKVEWTLVPGSSTISTRFFSVTIEGGSEELLPIEPPAVRVEIRAQGRSISRPVSAAYGFQEATKDVHLKLDPEAPQRIAKNTVALMIGEEPEVDQVTIHLLDATTGVSLARLEKVPIAISI